MMHSLSRSTSKPQWKESSHLVKEFENPNLRLWSWSFDVFCIVGCQNGRTQLWCFSTTLGELGRSLFTSRVWVDSCRPLFLFCMAPLVLCRKCIRFSNIVELHLAHLRSPFSGVWGSLPLGPNWWALRVQTVAGCQNIASPSCGVLSGSLVCWMLWQRFCISLRMVFVRVFNCF